MGTKETDVLASPDLQGQVSLGGIDKTAAARNAVSSQSEWQIAWAMLRKRPVAMAGLVGLILILVMTIAAPLIAPYDPVAMDYNAIMAAPTTLHLFGTDDLGRDILSRVLFGGRETLRIAFLAVAIAIGGGTTLGLVSGFYGGWLDTVMQRIVDIFLAFPFVLLLLSIVAALGPSLTTVLIAAGAASIPEYTRLARGSALSARNNEYVTAARVLGASDRQIMFRHILPNIIAPIIVYSTLLLGNVIIWASALSFVGLGAQPPSPEWGAMLAYGRSFLRQAWWMSVFPGVAVFVSVFCINLLGDGLRDAWDPKLRQ